MKDLLSGSDGALSMRRIIGSALIVLGAALLVIGQFQVGDVLGRIAPGSVALVAGLVFWGVVTVDNILSAVGRK